MNKLLSRVAAALLSVCATLAPAQQPQTQTAPIFDVNSKYVNGSAPGFWTVPSTGLVVSVSAGTTFCAGTVQQYAATNLSLSASTTNYVYLNTASNCVPAVKTSTFAATDIPLSIVVTSGSAITSVTDVRNPFVFNASANSPTGPQFKVAVYNGGGSGSSFAQGFANWTTDSTGNNMFVPGLTLANQPQEMWSATGFGSLATIFANSSYQAATQSSVLLEPTYTEFDNGTDSATGDRRSFLDLRQGYFRFRSMNPGPYHQFSNSNFLFECLNSDSPASPSGAVSVNNQADCMTTTYDIDLPGYYMGSTSYQVNFNTWQMSSFSAAINKSISSGIYTDQGSGDTSLFAYNLFHGYGGGDHLTDEGFHVDRFGIDIGSNFIATVNSSTDVPASGYKQLGLSFGSGPAMGTMRLLVDVTAATTDSVIGLTAAGDGTTTATMTGASYPVSTVTVLQTNINPPQSPTQAKVSETFTISTNSDLSGLGLVKFQFVGTPSPECSTVASWGAFNAGTSTQTVTALLGDQHNAGTNKVYFGGMACDGLTYDAQTASTGVLSTFYVFGSTANNKLVVGRYAGGSPDPAFLAGGPVHVYPMSRVLDVRGPGGTDTTVKVERSGATWNVSDTVESGLIATSRNDTFFYNLTDNSPLTQGATYTYNILGSWAGGILPRDFVLVNNVQPITSYQWNPGTPGPWTIGSWFHWMGQIGGVFNIEQPLHGAFLTEFNCGYTLVDGGGNASIASACSGVGGNIGWNIKGDTQFVGARTNHTLASFADTNNIKLNAPTTISSPLIGGVPLTLIASSPNDALDVTGNTVFTGNIGLIGTLSMGGSSEVITGLFNMPSNTDCTAAFDHMGFLGCNTTILTAPAFVAQTGGGFNGYTVQDPTQSNHVVGNVGNNGGALSIGAANCGTGFCGFIQLSAPLGILETAPLVQIASGLLIGSDGTGITIASNSPDGNTGAPLNLEVSGFTTSSPQIILHSQGVQVSGGLAELDLAPNGGLTKFGGLEQDKQYTVGILPAAVVGQKAAVTDATAFTPGSAPTGGGSAFAPVFCSTATCAGGSGTGWIMY